MTDDRDFEPFDALLEEALADEGAASATRPRRWLTAALVLLGLGVVAAILATSGERAEPVPAQDPQPPVELSFDDAVEAMPDVTGLRVAGVHDVAPDVWRVLLADFGAVNRCKIKGDVPAGEAVPLLFRRGDSAPFPGELLVHRPTAFVVFGDRAVHFGGAAFEQWQQVVDDARLASGIARSLDELRRLPATARTVRCPCLTAELVRAELPRFAQLEELAFVEQGLSQLPHGEIVEAIAELTTVRSLELPGRFVGDAELEVLRRMPELTSLVLTGQSTKVSADGLAACVGLRGLGLRLDAADPALVGALRRLPRLTEFSARGGWVTDEVLAELLTTKLEVVEIERSALTERGFAALQGLPSLRRLTLRGDISIDLDNLRDALPGRDVVHDPAAEPLRLRRK